LARQGSGPSIFEGAISANGTMAVITDQPGEGHLLWYASDGRQLSEVGTPGEMYSPAISRDGSRVLVARRLGGPDGNQDIWTIGAGGTETRLTNSRAWDAMPNWSPDGREIVYVSGSTSGGMKVLRQAATGLGGATEVFEGRGMVTDWSRDGKYLVYAMTSSAGDDLHLFDLSSNKKSTLRATPVRERFGQFYPLTTAAGRFVAYSSDESGPEEVYVEKFEGSPPQKVQVSSGSGSEPRWRADGRELYYRANSKLWAVSVAERGGLLEFGAPRELFAAPERPLAGSAYSYDVSPDGKRFLFNAVVRSTVPEISVTLKWAEDLRKKLKSAR
jgi:eukaryotic-like serine/threonine-protein kinase